jgi:hypothetical protein
VDANYTISYVAGAITVSKAAVLTVTASSPAVSYGAAVPTVTPSYSGWVNGDTSSSLTTAPTCSTTYTTTSAPGTYPTTCSGAVDANYTITYVVGTVSVSKATPTVYKWPSASTIGYGQTLSSSTLSGGTASVPGTFAFTAPATVPVLGTQAESVTFTPTDTTDYITVTGAVNVTVNQLDFTLTATGGTTLTIKAGGSASYSFTISPLYGQYPGPVALTVSGLPTGMTGAFTPSNIAATAGTQQVALTIHSSSSTAQAQPETPGKAWPMFTLALVLLPLGWVRSLRRHGCRLRGYANLLLLGMVLTVVSLATGCGGLCNFSQNSDDLTVTATGGSISHSIIVTLNLQQ